MIEQMLSHLLNGMKLHVLLQLLLAAAVGRGSGGESPSLAVGTVLKIHRLPHDGRDRLAAHSRYAASTHRRLQSISKAMLPPLGGPPSPPPVDESRAAEHDPSTAAWAEETEPALDGACHLTPRFCRAPPLSAPHPRRGCTLLPDQAVRMVSARRSTRRRCMVASSRPGSTTPTSTSVRVLQCNTRIL